jgi:glycosyltransferase involved in cell wall biosynthesis
VRLSLESLRKQSDPDFKVIFVDYGSDKKTAAAVNSIVSEYPFAKYIYCDTRYMVWNRSHALNVAIRIAETPYVFTSDIDMIYEPGLVSMLNKLADPEKAYFFSSVMLPPGKLPEDIPDRKPYLRISKDALGWGFIPVAKLLQIGSYDEVYCIWGKEDNDIGYRLEKAGCKVEYISEIWMNHYYHPPVPNQREVLPADWFLFLTDYFESRKEIINRNSADIWGELVPPDTRKAPRLLEDPSTFFVPVKGRYRFFRYSVERAFQAAESGSILSFIHHDELHKVYSASTVSKVSSVVNRGFDLLKLPFMLNGRFDSNKEDVYDTRDELLYFLIARKDEILDYAFTIEAGDLKVVVLKK